MALRLIFALLIALTISISCDRSQPSEIEVNKEIVQEAFEVISNGEFDKIEKYISSDYIRHCQATPDVNVRSLSEFKEFLKMDRQAIPDQKLEIKKLVAEGEFVAFWATYKGTQSGQMGPFPPSNKYAELDFSGIHRIENQKIAESWITWDNMAILKQLGHLPPTPIE